MSGLSSLKQTAQGVLVKVNLSQGTEKHSGQKFDKSFYNPVTFRRVLFTQKEL